MVLLPGGDLPMEELTMQSIHGLPIATSLEEACDPRRLAILIYDMQVGILEQITDRERVIQNVREVLEAARGLGSGRTSRAT